MYVGGVVGLLVVALVLLSGCVKTPGYKVEYRLSDPYNLSSGVIEMRFNATAYVTVNNSESQDIRVSVDDSKLTAYYEDGTSEEVRGSGEEGVVIPAGSVRTIALTFTGIPVKYTLVDDPPRFHSLVKYYDVDVVSSGSMRLWFVWSPAKTSTEHRRIPMKDVPLGDTMDGLKSSMFDPEAQ